MRHEARPPASEAPRALPAGRQGCAMHVHQAPRDSFSQRPAPPAPPEVGPGACVPTRCRRAYHAAMLTRRPLPLLRPPEDLRPAGASGGADTGAAQPWPALGLGTWRMGEQRGRRAGEVAAVRTALDMGYRLIDTAEMYGEGGAEEVVGQALAQAFAAGLERARVTVVSKVYPHNATANGVRQACDRSRRRLGLDHIDLYLLHWRGAVPLRQTVDGLQALQARGEIGRWGVSNFDLSDLEELAALDGGRACAANQVWYSLGQRGPEFDLLPWQRARGLPLMAYSPIDQGGLSQHRGLGALAAELGIAAAQLALAWALREPGVVAIPKAGRAEHLAQNLEAAQLVLPAPALARLDELFPPPRAPVPLAMN
jgi:diketogulonate reductase-like aldo/keto reductase